MVHHPRKAHPHEFSQSKFQSRIRHLQAAPRIRRPRGLVRRTLQRRQVIDKQAYFVDLPGYGYAKVSKSELGRWSELIEGYFNQDRDFALVVSLIDIRHEPTALDRNMVSFLIDAELPFAIALTKADKLSKQQMMKQRNVIVKTLDLPEGTPVVITSSEKGIGIDELRALIAEAVGER